MGKSQSKRRKEKRRQPNASTSFPDILEAVRVGEHKKYGNPKKTARSQSIDFDKIQPNGTFIPGKFDNNNKHAYNHQRQGPNQQGSQSNYKLFRALYDFEVMQEGDLHFKKGDIIKVSSDIESDWWFGETKERRGYVPKNYLTPHDQHDAKTHPAFQPMERKDAERELVRPVHKAGDFILRPCHTEENSWALSIKYQDGMNLDIKHYKIKYQPETQSYSIHSKNKFSSIFELTEFYSNNAGGLVCQLSTPCTVENKPPVNFRDMIINHKSVSLAQKLGSGSFGEVWLGKLLDKVDVAIKKIKPGSFGSQHGLKDEAMTQHKLLHKNIVQVLGYCEDPSDGSFLLIMEYVERGSLHGILHKEPDLTLEGRIDFIGQIADGMAYIEERDVIHRDLRAVNVLVSKTNLVKIADFGLARVIEVDDDDYKIDRIYQGKDDCKFPIRWTAIEGLTRHEFSVKSDVWSFGILMYEILSKGKKPYEDLSTKQVIHYVSSGGMLKNPLQSHYTTGTQYHRWTTYLYNEIMVPCWKHKKEERPTFASISTIFNDFSTTVENAYAPV